MPSDRKQSEPLSLAEKLFKVYQLSNKTLDFSETKNEIAAMQWVQRIMAQIQENERRQQINDK